MVYKKKEGVHPLASKAAKLMGQIGGKARTDAKLAAVRENVKNAHRPEAYTYKRGVYCMLGVNNPKKCLMPLEVLADLKAYKGRSFTIRENFPGGEFKRHHVYFRYVDKKGTIEVDDKGMVHVWTWQTGRKKKAAKSVQTKKKVR